MSAYGYKRTSRGLGRNVRFTPESGRKWVGHRMSAFDPKRKLMVLGVCKSFMANRVVTIVGTGNAASHNASAGRIDRGANLEPVRSRRPC